MSPCPCLLHDFNTSTVTDVRSMGPPPSTMPLAGQSTATEVTLLPATIALLFLTWLFTSLRVVVRIRLAKAFHAEDYAFIFAQVRALGHISNDTN